jgi:hypothetical protein
VVEIVNEKLKRYESPRIGQSLEEMIQTGGNISLSEIHKVIKSV